MTSRRNGIFTDRSTYAVAGRLTASTNALGNATTYSVTANGLTNTTTFASGTTRIETLYQDGSLKSVTGSAVHGSRFEYGADSNGAWTKEIKLNPNGSDTSEWTKTYTDMVGRPYLIVHSDGSKARSYFNDNGQLVKQVAEDGVTTLLAYNAKGEQEYVAVDMNQNGSIDFNGTDRISRVQRSVVSDQGTVKRRTTTTVWTTEGTGDTETVNVSETSADGLQSWSTSFGLTTHSQTICAVSGMRSNIVTAADGSTTVSAYQNGRLISVVRKDVLGSQLSSLSYAYDLHGRQQTATDARTGATTFSYDDSDRLTSVSGNGQTTSYGYDNVDRQTTITLPDSGVVTNQYWDTGELKKTFGVRTYTVEYTYDYAGRLKTMLAGTGTTTWNYDANRGFLTSKIYADSNGTTYSNSVSGRIVRRTWARGITTDYGYNNAGDLTAITYSDSTPDVTYTLDRRGRRTSVAWGTNTVNLSYNAAGQLTNENWSAGILRDISVISGYDSVLRRTSLAVESAVSGLVSSVSYTYDSASRLSTVSSGPDSVEYVYLANSSLLTNTIFKHNGSTVMTTTKNYDNLNRLTSISSVLSPQSTVLSSHTYLYNSANQRIKATLQDGSYWEYAYDSLGQVTNAVKRWSDNVLVAGQQFGYAYDSIGNRTSAKSGGDQNGLGLRSSTYTPNSLNQYTQRTVPDSFDVIGSAQSNATVTVNNLPAYRKGEYFWRELTVTNAAAPQYPMVSVVGVKNNVGTNQEDAVTTVTGNEYILKTPEVYSYDLDGNLTQDGRWTYTWDGENRLIAMESLTNAPSASKKKLEFAYDHQSRRIRKKAYNWNGGSYALTNALLFVYDNWNLQAELDALTPSPSALRTYVWGLDLSGSEHGAGGVGGLLRITIHDSFVTSHFVAYDGNGNVAALLEADSGEQTAGYEYLAFGEALRATGPAAASNPFRFSTKYDDGEAGMRYYGFRYYSESTGRWPNRDPVGEEGGVNLYGFIANSPLNAIDLLGLKRRTIRYVGKSFINGVGPLGSLGNRAGLPTPPGFISVNGVDLADLSGDGQYADQRLAILASLVGGLSAFNENPQTDAKDGKYRLYGKVEITARCCGSILTTYSYETDKEGGNELPGIDGTINMDAEDVRGAWGFSLTSAMVAWRTWGRPNIFVEPGMQWVAFRSSVNIWHRGIVTITCDSGEPAFTVRTFRGSCYPSRRLWEDGVLIRDVRQGSYSDLWRAQSWWEPTMVAE